MSACECCWRDSRYSENYEETLTKHEERDCICTHSSIEGRSARAGEWWDAETQRDRRDDVESR